MNRQFIAATKKYFPIFFKNQKRLYKNKSLILLIEDNNDIRESFAELLALEGFEIKMANSGIQGLKLAIQLQPNLIICDIIMPGMDGYQVLQALMLNEITSQIPFIFSSSSSESADVKKGLDFGAKHFFIKPFDDNYLIQWIKSCLDINSLQELK